MFDLIRTRMDLRMEDIGSRSQANTNSHGILGRGKGWGRERHENVNSDLNHRTPPRGKIETRCTTVEGYLGERGGMMRCCAGIDKEDFPVRYSIRFRNPFRIPARRLSPSFHFFHPPPSLPLRSGGGDARGQDTRHQSFLSSLRSGGAARFHDQIPPSIHPLLPRSIQTPFSPLPRFSYPPPIFSPLLPILAQSSKYSNISLFTGKEETRNPRKREEKKEEKEEEECERQGGGK